MSVGTTTRRHGREIPQLTPHRPAASYRILVLVKSTTLTPEQRVIRARVGAYALHAQGGTSTKAGTAAFMARFERQVDPDGTLPPEVRARRAEQARKAYMSTLALRSSRARANKKADAEGQSPASAMEATDAPGDPVAA